jgi:hypothetical protein
VSTAVRRCRPQPGSRLAAGHPLNAAQWTPRELRHSFVSLLSDKGVPIEQIARLVGHTGESAVTQTIYRKQLRPVINEGAVAMNELFPRTGSYSVRYSAPSGKIKEAWSGAPINAPDQAF